MLKRMKRRPARIQARKTNAPKIKVSWKMFSSALNAAKASPADAARFIDTYKILKRAGIRSVEVAAGKRITIDEAIKLLEMGKAGKLKYRHLGK